MYICACALMPGDDVCAHRAEVGSTMDRNASLV